MADNTDTALNCRFIDPRRTVCLCDVGGDPDYIATVTVAADGSETLWLAHEESIGRNDIDHGNENPSHEKLGRLPKAIRDRIWGEALLCGRLLRTGRPCRMRVAEPGGSCPQHQDLPIATPSDSAGVVDQ